MNRDLHAVTGSTFVLCFCRMKLPNASLVIVERGKIEDYLLNPAHRSGAGKAKFFGLFGFQRERWQELEQALRQHALTQEVAEVKETGFGPRYAVEGPLDTPVGRRPLVRSVWQHDDGMVAPRLITAYALEEKP
jgi:hypothetical protein